MTKRAYLVELILLAALTAIFTGVATTAAQEAEAQAPAEATAEAAAEGDAAEEGKVQRIKLKDGREIEGKVTRTETGDIRIEAKYGVLTFKADDVVSVEDVVAPQDAYMERKSGIDAEDPEALYGLARWVVNEHGNNLDLLENAQTDLQKALKLKKDYKHAEFLLRMVDQRLKSLKGQTAVEADGGATGPTKFDKDELVTERDIYSIRLQELRSTDRVRVKFENDLVERFIELMRRSKRSGWDKRSTERKFLALSPQRKLNYILEQEPNNWNLLKDIRIESDPAFMLDFRNKVWPILRRKAASAKNKYGANLMNGYQFKISASGGDRVDYTNFVILVGYKRGGVRMVNRQKPEDSLILKAGLQESIDPEKDPASVTPSYTMMNSSEYKTVMEWIKLLDGPLEPDYHLEWQPPKGVTIDCDGKPDMPGLGE